MLLTTKLMAPTPSGHLVGRPRLVGDLRHEGRRVTLISAPAGSGKTTLLAEWIVRDRPAVAWLSLDRRDNARDRFAGHLLAAVSKACPALSEEIDELDGSGAELGQMEALLNAVAAFGSPLTLVFDDYHCIDDETVHGWVELLLEYQPQNLHVVLSTRKDPPLPLSRLRVRRRLHEIRTSDLQFTAGEASDLLASVLGRSLERAQVESLCSRTEGWAAGLQLAGLSLRTASDPREVIAEFTGENRHVVDYLTDEVLAGLDPGLREFMLKTSILEALCAPLCHALTGLDDSAQLLADLERANLFVVPLDQNRHWFRYHHLFAELLRSRLLERHGSAEVARLEVEAAEWYAQSGEVEAAIESAISALARPGCAQVSVDRALDLLMRLLEKHGHGLFTAGRRFQVEAWLDRLPDKVKGSRPGLALLTAKILVIQQRRQEAERFVTAAEVFGQAPGIPDGRRKLLRAEIAVVRASLALRRWQMEDVLRYADQALQGLAGDDQSNRAHVLLSSGLASRWLGQIQAARHALEGAEAAALESGDALIGISARVGLVRLLLEEGRPADAEASCQKALALYDEKRWVRYPSIAFLHTAFAEILWERGKDGAARDQIDQALKRTPASISSKSSVRREALEVTRALLRLIDVSPSEGADVGRRYAPEAMSAESRLLPLLPPLEELHARLCLRAGAVEPVRAWLDEENISGDGPFVPGLFGRHLLLARVLIAEGRAVPAADLLGRLLAAIESAGFRRYLVDGFACLALARRHSGLSSKASEAAAEAVSVAAPEGASRAFIEIGPELVPLLEPHSQGHPHLVPGVLGALGRETTSSSPGLTEPLSEREQEVLTLLYGGLSNQEIADRLFVSRNTVKTHVRNIYGKIEAKNRGQAIARIRELGLL